jgi:hypothetical protein
MEAEPWLVVGRRTITALPAGDQLSGLQAPAAAL